MLEIILSSIFGVLMSAGVLVGMVGVSFAIATALGRFLPRVEDGIRSLCGWERYIVPSIARGISLENLGEAAPAIWTEDVPLTAHEERASVLELAQQTLAAIEKEKSLEAASRVTPVVPVVAPDIATHLPVVPASSATAPNGFRFLHLSTICGTRAAGKGCGKPRRLLHTESKLCVQCHTAAQTADTTVTPAATDTELTLPEQLQRMLEMSDLSAAVAPSSLQPSDEAIEAWLNSAQGRHWLEVEGRIRMAQPVEEPVTTRAMVLYRPPAVQNKFVDVTDELRLN